MARFLFVVPPLAGHVNPTISVARQLELRGHEVAWCGHPTVVRPLLPPQARLYELDERVLQRAAFDRNLGRARYLRGLPAFKFLWEEVFAPLARIMLPDVEQAVALFEPDVLVCDQQALAGAIASRRRGLRWATFCTTSAAVSDTLDTLPTVKAWRDALLRQLQSESGIDPVDQPDLSPELVVVFSTATLVRSTNGFPRQFAFVGPSIDYRPSPIEFPWQALADQPRVLISMGTINGAVSQRFFRSAVEALAGESLQVILVAPDSVAVPQARNVLRRSYVPQLDLLPRVDAVVCHAGHNTVCEALAHGIPLVVAPIKDDQPVVAQQVVESGAGLRVKFGRVHPCTLRTAVRRVLEEPSFRKAAAGIQTTFRRAGGAAAAADRLADLAGS